jgi:hypothetical protein
MSGQLFLCFTLLPVTGTGTGTYIKGAGANGLRESSSRVAHPLVVPGNVVVPRIVVVPGNVQRSRPTV